MDSMRSSSMSVREKPVSVAMDPMLSTIVPAFCLSHSRNFFRVLCELWLW